MVKILLLIMLGCAMIKAQNAENPQHFSKFTILQQYIEKGLSENLALNQKEFELEQHIQSIREARGKFFPSISVEARYSRAGGGRIIDIPIGDLLNPVYSALNITDPSGNPLVLENQTTRFLREKEHETKIRAIQPLFQPALYYNYRIHKTLRHSKESERDAYKRFLIMEIKSAYFNYLKTLELKELYLATRDLVEENQRVSQRLFDVEKVTKDVLLRAQTEVYEIEQRISEAEQYRINAQSYFNHLLNRPLETDIHRIKPEIRSETDEVNLEQAIGTALSGREELIRLNQAANAAGESAKLAGTGFLPGISAVADYGYQGERYRFGDDDDFWMVSGVLSWNLFNGFQDASKIQKAKLEQKKLLAKVQETKNQITLQVTDSFNKLNVMRRQLIKADLRVKSAAEVYTMIEKRFQQGLASQIELIDARTAKTRAEVELVMTKFDYLSEQARFERAIATINLKG